MVRRGIDAVAIAIAAKAKAIPVRVLPAVGVGVVPGEEGGALVHGEGAEDGRLADEGEHPLACFGVGVGLDFGGVLN
jgi:hypothetical protein